MLGICVRSLLPCGNGCGFLKGNLSLAMAMATDNVAVKECCVLMLGICVGSYCSVSTQLLFIPGILPPCFCMVTDFKILKILCLAMTINVVFKDS